MIPQEGSRDYRDWVQSFIGLGVKYGLDESEVPYVVWKCSKRCKSEQKFINYFITSCINTIKNRYRDESRHIRFYGQVQSLDCISCPSNVSEVDLAIDLSAILTSHDLFVVRQLMGGYTRKEVAHKIGKTEYECWLIIREIRKKIYSYLGRKG